MDDIVDPTMMDVSAYSESYPSPATTADDIKESSQPPSEQPSKKKRKAWGQPVPEIKQILPPRKRAKTAEEKEQRKNERILRNRRAADKSRQRQKAAVAELEARQNRIVQENASLRELLARYQSRFGVQSDFPAPAPAPAADSSMLDLDVASTPIELKSDSPFTPSSYETPQPQHPTLVPSDNTTPIKQESPVLAPQLNIINQHIEAEQSDSMATYQSFPAVSGLTQYPAVILCDLQCQPETWAFKLPAFPCSQTNNFGLSYLLQVFQTLTIFQTFSTTTLLPIYNLFQILAQRLSATSTEQDFSSILNNFPLIHSLISMPSTPTRPAVFRMKLLSRLLACSPHMARLLLAATDRALQQVVSEDGFAEDPERRWTWSSLMTIKWTILRLEKEHRKIRRRVWANRDEALSGVKVMAGVDYRAVARNSQLWQGMSPNCTITTGDDGWMPQEVH
ncbi:transcription factor that binds to CRE motif [Exophiala xenobiotica]|nr:transcription factor that binds to CRE motif [Exophiala xenobiotica]